MKPDFLDKMIAKRSARNPAFSRKLDLARARRSAAAEDRVTGGVNGQAQAALKHKLEAKVDRRPEVSDEDLADEILSRRLS